MVSLRSWIPPLMLPLILHKLTDEVEALEEEFHDLVLNQQSSSSASASTSSNLGSSLGKRPLTSVED
ncbi:hypothetical protein CMV_012474 [Castanea mollissima]|uniref:Uncharacterized protein n=1 Tax=Castanea mollissima TaxID=60419 RepID=A0A8J4RFI8_9ROSI|nr:hypothetical protein CMV_012474 [Castanea mollissima]